MRESNFEDYPERLRLAVFAASWARQFGLVVDMSELRSDVEMFRQAEYEADCAVTAWKAARG